MDQRLPPSPFPVDKAYMPAEGVGELPVGNVEEMQEVSGRLRYID
jgi:hypothetical protein